MTLSETLVYHLAIADHIPRLTERFIIIMRQLQLSFCLFLLFTPILHADWQHPLGNWAKLESPLVEVTPFVFKDKLYRMESWQKQWEHPDDTDGSHFTKDEIRIRDMAADRIVSRPLIGHGLGMTYVWEDTVYVFAGNWGTEKKWNIRNILMTSSTDLINWTEPQQVLRSDDHEKFFNVSVCRGEDQFIMLVESNDKEWPTFTFKY